MIILISCSEKAKPPDNSTKSVISQKMSAILPFASPQTIEELYDRKYIVDSLYRSSTTNPEGVQERQYEINFTKITGIDQQKNWHKNSIQALNPTKFFDPKYESDSLIYLPFHVDDEREWTIFTVWKKTATNIQFVYHFKNLFITKYGRIRMIDKLQHGKIDYFLLESYVPNEDGMYRSLEIVSSLPGATKNLKSIYVQKLEKIDLEEIIPGSMLSIVDKKITLSRENNNSNDPKDIIVKLDLIN
ncbi:hypothetical protein N9B82_01465 [Saprospiraceae bacterium]|nr:hypothetical protein [Saprospiraceae bacterium]